MCLYVVRMGECAGEEGWVPARFSIEKGCWAIMGEQAGNGRAKAKDRDRKAVRRAILQGRSAGMPFVGLATHIFSRFFIGMAVLALFLLGNPCGVHAVVSGPCTDCHLMHVTDTVAPISNWPALVKADCLGCHSDSGRRTIVNNTPVVFNMGEPTYPPDNSDTSVLAGGNFHWVIHALGESRHQYGHNCFWINNRPDIDPNHTIAPGSREFKERDCQPCHYTLTTFGCESCHQVSHHDATFDPSNPSVNVPFRFLGPPLPDSPNPNVRAWANEHQYETHRVYGVQDSDWEQTLSYSDHNEYCGSKWGVNVDYSHSIDGFCRGCHQNIHMAVPGSESSSFASPWLRHPSGVALPAEKKKEAYLYNTSDGLTVGPYEPLVPLARTESAFAEMTGPSFMVTPGKDEVMCLSCHRAHGSSYPDMLRWDYATCSAGQPDPSCGCFVCHSAKW